MLLSEAVGKDERKSPTKGNFALLLRARNPLLSSETEGSLFPISIASTAFTFTSPHFLVLFGLRGIFTPLLVIDD